MKEHVADPKFQIKRQIEMVLEKQFPNEYASKYSLVTFNENIGYDEAMNKGRLQDKLLLEYIENNKVKEPFKLEAILEFLKLETNSIKIHTN
jgi:kynurenine 3-monooxygenase